MVQLLRALVFKSSHLSAIPVLGLLTPDTEIHEGQTPIEKKLKECIRSKSKIHRQKCTKTFPREAEE